MNKLKTYDLSFSGLKLGSHHFDYFINYSFFDLFNVEQEFSDCSIDVKVELTKGSAMLELLFALNGTVNVLCDVTAEEFPLIIENNWKVIVKFGEFFDDTDDEFITLPIGEHQINLAKSIYEGILVSIPLKKINPDAKNSEKYTQIKDLLKKLKPNENFQNQKENKIDDRWEKLKDIKI